MELRLDEEGLGYGGKVCCEEGGSNVNVEKP